MPFESDLGSGSGRLRYLWLTWIDPGAERDGQRMYSGRLIHAVASTGASVDVLCFESDDDGAAADNGARRATFWTVPRVQRPGWASVLSPLPNVAYRCHCKEMRRRLRALLAEDRWDVVVLDGLASGWALDLLRATRRFDKGDLRLVYVSHNHETTTRGKVAEDYGGSPLTRWVLRRDARKVSRLEQGMVEASDVVTAITTEDASLFARDAPEKKILTLPPGYAGHRVERHAIGPETPRTAIMVGSFRWIAKRMNLDAFVQAADPLFHDAGVKLQIVGGGPAGFIDDVSRRSRAIEFTGEVDDIRPYTEHARLAVVPELTGGGFKLKLLDYVFHRLPVLAIDGSLAGAPLKAGETALTYKGFEELAHGVVEAIDDLDLLNRLQNGAYDACDGRFDWRQRGELFVDQTAYA